MGLSDMLISNMTVIFMSDILPGPGPQKDGWSIKKFSLFYILIAKSESYVVFDYAIFKSIIYINIRPILMTIGCPSGRN